MSKSLYELPGKYPSVPKSQHVLPGSPKNHKIRGINMTDKERIQWLKIQIAEVSAKYNAYVEWLNELESKN